MPHFVWTYLARVFQHIGLGFSQLDMVVAQAIRDYHVKKEKSECQQIHSDVLVQWIATLRKHI